jgi:ATP-dependent Lhr-like helicase
LEQQGVFNLLARPVQDFLEQQGLHEPTEPQEKAIPLILKGENVLLVAPTGSGKTEAVVLPVFSRIFWDRPKEGISILYITPLRALNRDIIKRISSWALKLDLRVEVRHGDTETKIRRKQAIQPPNLLVTTPETLQAILPGSRMQKHLSHVWCVIIDEIHELITEKRGSQLSVALERLFELTGKEFQRIGLSATVENTMETAMFVAGSDRTVKVVEISQLKSYIYKIENPVPIDSDYSLAEQLRTAPEAAARIRRILNLVRQHKSTLIFVNSRTNAELLGHRLGILTDGISVHHGSLSKGVRKRIEDEFKANLLKAIVCTSTMELGIDIGQVDLVIQYLSPRQVGSLIQRVGRSGHRLGLVSKGVIITAFSEDVLESLSASKRALKGQLEPLLIHENPLDVLAHQTAGILLDKEVIGVEDLLDIFNRAYTFRSLEKGQLLEVAKYLHFLGEVWLEDYTLRKTRRTRDYYYRNLSMIPDERRYPIIDVLSDRKIGSLGDEFMALRARLGLNFICRGKVWRIVQIEDETGNVFVVPSEDKFAAIPGWDGEMIPVPYDLAKEVGKLRKTIEKELTKSNIKLATEKLAKKLQIDKSALSEPIKEIHDFLKEGLTLPSSQHILLEAFDKYIVVHSCFGETTNRTIGSIFDAILSDHELIVGWWNDAYRILIETPRKINVEILDKIAHAILRLTPTEAEIAFKEYIDTRFPFAYRMKFVAERFGALPRGRTMGPQRLGELPSRFKNTPIYDETIREAMVEKMDLPSAKQIFTDIDKGKIKINKLLRTKKPTLIAYNIFAKYSKVAELMAPEQVILSNIERMKKSAMMRKVRLLCLTCGESAKEKKIKSLNEKPICKKCNSGLLAKLMFHQDPKRAHALLKRRKAGKKLTTEELENLTYLRRTADLVLSYGQKALVALQTKGVGPETAFRILGKMHPNDDEFYLDLLKAKILYIKSSPYWKGKKDTVRQQLRGENNKKS